MYTKWASAYLVSNVELFVRSGGLEEILERVKNKQPRTPLSVLRCMLKLVLKVRTYVNWGGSIACVVVTHPRYYRAD